MKITKHHQLEVNLIDLQYIYLMYIFVDWGSWELQPTPRLSSIWFASRTLIFKMSPRLAHGHRVLVPTLTWVHEEHLIPYQDTKSPSLPFSRKMIAKLSSPVGMHGINSHGIKIL